MRYYKQTEKLLEKLPRQIQVEFALYCAKDVLHLVLEKNKVDTQNCMDTVEGYLRGEKTGKDCLNITRIIYIGNNNVGAADAAVYYTVNAAAADKTVYIAYNATEAAYWAAKAKKVGIKEYYEVLLSWTNELSIIEKLIYGIE